MHTTKWLLQLGCSTYEDLADRHLVERFTELCFAEWMPLIPRGHDVCSGDIVWSAHDKEWVKNVGGHWTLDSPSCNALARRVEQPATLPIMQVGDRIDEATLRWTGELWVPATDHGTVLDYGSKPHIRRRDAAPVTKPPREDEGDALARFFATPAGQWTGWGKGKP